MNRLWALIFPVLLICAAELASAREDLAKASQNPVGNIISLPFEYWHYDGIADDSSIDAVAAKPVYPVTIGALNLINRFIVPYLWADVDIDDVDIGDIPAPQTEFSESGLGNIQYQGFLTPAAPGKVVWALGRYWRCPPTPITWVRINGQQVLAQLSLLCLATGCWACWCRIFGRLPAQAKRQMSTNSHFNILSTTTCPGVGT